MKLASIISILFLKGGKNNDMNTYRIYFENNEDLYSKICDLQSRLEDSDEELSNPKLICDFILNNKEIKAYIPDMEGVNRVYSTYGGKDIEEFKETNEELYGFMYKALVKARQEEYDKGKSKYIDLTRGDLYQLFSKSSLRISIINKIKI